MAVTFGFYNSINRDRRYNALQMGMIFDGIIRPGVFSSIGTWLKVTASGTDRNCVVGIGRAWFDHTWTYNDAPLPLPIDQSELLLDRIDTVVIDVDQREASRKNDIFVLKGTPSSNPSPPSLIVTADHNQYPIANVRVNRGSTFVTQASITNLIGVDPRVPFVLGALANINVADLISQWEDQWTQFFNEQTNDMRQTALDWEAQWDAWYNSETSNDSAEWRAFMEQQKALWLEFVAQMEDITDETVQAKIVDLQNRVAVLEAFKEVVTNEFRIYYGIEDSSNDKLLDSQGAEIEGQAIFCMK